MQRKTDELRSLADQDEIPPSGYRIDLAFQLATLQLGNIPHLIHNQLFRIAIDYSNKFVAVCNVIHRCPLYFVHPVLS